MRTGLVILIIDRGLACLGVSGDFEYGLYADQSAYPKQIQRSGIHWIVSGDFENGYYADQSGYPQHIQRSCLPLSVR